MKAYAFLHTCAIHITLDYSAVARIWGNHKLSGTPNFWRCEDSITVSLSVSFLSCFQQCKNLFKQECTNPGCQITWKTKFCMVEPNICGALVWNLFHVTVLAPRILRWLIDFWKICEPLSSRNAGCVAGPLCHEHTAGLLLAQMHENHWKQWGVFNHFIAKFSCHVTSFESKHAFL